MKNAKGPIYFSMILVTFLLFFLAYAVYDQSHIDPINKPNDNESASSSETQTIEYTWNGVYNKSDNSLTISVYKISSDQIVIVNKSNDALVYFGNISNANEYIFEYNNVEYKIVNDQNNLTISSDLEDSLTGTYVLVNIYTYDNYLSDTIGNQTYLNSVWNGIYTNNSLTAKIYQLDKEKCVIYVYNNDLSIEYNQIVTISNSTLNYEDDADAYKKVKIYFTSGKLIIEASSTNALDNENNINGSYVKSGKYSYEEIIANLR